MRLRPPLRVNVTRHEEKEQKLQAFLAHHLERRSYGADPARLLVVARSLESPVVRALVSLADDIAHAGICVRMILAQIDRGPLPEDWTRSVTFTHELRWAKHPRLIEAHEQLVLGPEVCWIGDCMRRDPAKCDAYESFVEDCGEAAGCAAVSFERLWHACQPLVGPGALPVIEAAPQPTVGTRH
jgi:hypothetical protein